MRADDPSNWHKCVLCHDSLWDLGLDKIEVVAYTYLSTFCHNGFSISLTLMSKRLGIKTHRLKLAIDRLIERKMMTKTERTGYAALFKITTMRTKGWGQTALPPAPNGTTPPAPNGTTTQRQTAPLTTYLDSDFLSLFHAHFPKWTFNKKPIGKYFVFTRQMQTKALEMMRWLHKNREGFSTPQGFTDFLTKSGEYLAHDRDVLSPAKDQRALSPAKWLHDWPAQVTLVGVYIEEQERKITRMPLDGESTQ